MELRLRFMFGLANVAAWFLHPIFWLRKLPRRRILPPIDDDLLTISATKLAAKIRKKQITSEQLVMSYIKRIKQVNIIINAVVEDRFTAALEEARQVDLYLQNGKYDLDDLRQNKPLLGVPVTIKESIGLKGMSQCVGSKLRLGFKASEDGGAVARLKKAGAIPLLVSNTPECCLYWETNNLVTGCTRNPYNTHYTSGGSSGGEGALLGAAASVISLGSDIAGSIRLPALFNGVFGHKPTSGLVSVENHFPGIKDPELLTFLVVGPLTRYAEDLKLVMRIINENPNISFDEKIDFRDLTVYYMNKAEKSMVITNVDKEIQQVMRECVNHLKHNCYATLSQYKFKMEGTFEMCGSTFYSFGERPEILQNINENAFLELIKSTGQVSKYSRNGIVYQMLNNNHAFVPKRKYEKYSKIGAELKADLESKLGNNGIFLYPTYPTAAFQHDQFVLKTSGIMYLMLFNIFGFPSTHVPLGLNKKGLPIGIQVVAGMNNDRLCFAVAEELERAFGGWVAPS